MNKTDSTIPERAAMSSLQKTSLVAGAFYLLTFVSIPTLALYSQVKIVNYIVGSGPDTPVIIGGILEIIVALAGIGTAVVLYPVLRKQNERIFQSYQHQMAQSIILKSLYYKIIVPKHKNILPSTFWMGRKISNPISIISDRHEK